MNILDKFKMPEKKTSQSSQVALKGGFYSIAMTIIVLALLIAINILVGVLPKTLTKLDISSTNLYSITSNTKAVVNNLSKDVTIYWIVQNDEEDDVVENLLEKYGSLSSHLTVVKKNPDVYPTFASAYTDETVSNNSIIVECGTKYRYIAYEDIYLTDIDYTTYSYVYSFDGEGAITSAIDYVVSDELPVIYTLEGHGEAALPSEFATQIEKDNIEVQSLSLPKVDEIPEDADAILIYSPTSDLSDEEKDMLAEYLENGGKIMAFVGPTEDGTLENFYALLGDYGITAEEGLVIEADRNYYAFQQPYILLPEINSNAITDSLLDEKRNVILPISQGMNTENATNATVNVLLATSDEAFSKLAGYALTTYEKEEGDIDGPFALAVSVINSNEGQLIWVSASDCLSDDVNAYSSGGNIDFAMNGLSSLIGSSESLAIRSKSIGYNYLTISEESAGMLKAVMIFILPAVIVGIGVVITIRRRKMKHE